MRGLRIVVTLAALLAVARVEATDDAIFVSATSGNENATGLTPETPVRSISQGLNRAASTGRTQVHVTGGVYNAFTMVNGIHVVGGYGQNFERDKSATGSTTTEVRGTYNPALGYDVVIAASGITLPTTLSGLVLTQNTSSPERNSIGLAIRNSTSALNVEYLRITGTSIAASMAGSPGLNVSSTPAAAGAPGANAISTSLCDASTRRSGGAGGSNPLVGSYGLGGAGGAGGTEATHCGGLLPYIVGTAGLAGSTGPYASQGSGAGGPGGPPNSTTAGAAGLNGQDGHFGYSGTTEFGTLVMGSGNPFRKPGTAGGAGTAGAGGGGGGGGGGISGYAAGAGGGGGGAGGLHSNLGGSPGKAGGNSVAILLFASSPIIRNCSITRGAGGAGGSGGAGGMGQSGGAGGAGGSGRVNPTTNTIQGAGGAGGHGGRGGNSGPGAGGPGGHSIGILRDPGSAPTLTNITYVGGSAGPGGAAAPANPLQGYAGLPGNVYDTFVASPN